MARIRRVYGPAASNTGAATTKYTVGAGMRAVLRHLHLQNPTAGAITFTCSIGADAAGTRLLDAVTVPANTDAATRGVVDYFWAEQMAAAEIFQSTASSASLVVTLSAEEEII